ncbi:MAG TPA: hypothetical protein VGR02_09495 [Thermoanaerobaculia bacterium]|nr:hypothetical protein [Thermoanaerobaculia bacterium]
MHKELVTRNGKDFAVAAKPVTVTLAVSRAKTRLAKAKTIVLELEGVHAKAQPGFLVSVRIGDAEVGRVALYTFAEPQTFAFDATEAVKRCGGTVKVRFVPLSPLEGEGVRVASPIRISGVALSIERP